MNVQQLRKNGNSFIVTVPKELVEANGWGEGTLLALELHEMTLVPTLRPELAAAVDRDWPAMEPTLRRLAAAGEASR